MKNILSISIILMAVFFFSIPANAQWTDAGTANNNDPRYKEITFQGAISGTGNLTSNSFDFINFSNVYDMYKYFTQTNDSVKITILLRGNEYSGKWTVIDTLYNSTTTATQTFLTDTVATTTFTAYDLYLVGISGNGYKSNFYGKLKFRK